MSTATSSGVRSSRLHRSSANGASAVGAMVSATGSPRTTRSRFGRSCQRRVPAPKPVRTGAIAGQGENVEAWARTRLAPVGVTISPSSGACTVGTPASTSSTAGAGIGRIPWAARTKPRETGSGPAFTLAPSQSSAAEAETMSTMASTPPTS